MQFFNHKNELALMSLLDKSKPSFLVITGKRRVGKTELKAVQQGQGGAERERIRDGIKDRDSR